MSHDGEPRWEPDPESLAMLDTSGPFEHRGVREAIASAEGLRDVSFGACLPDGTRAALAMLARRGVGTCVPWGYGAVRSSRALSAVELERFLDTARRHRRLWRVVVQEIGPSRHGNARVVTTTHVVALDPGRDPRAGYSGSTRTKLNRAERAGLEVRVSSNLEGFLPLYAEASRGWGSECYPSEALHAIAVSGVGRCYDVFHDGEVIASALALVADDHWMYWLGVSGDAGRRFSAGHVAVAALIDDAWRAGVGAVNLGASEVAGRALPGVAEFKQRFGGVDVPFSRASRAVPGVEPLMRAGAPVWRRLSTLRSALAGRGNGDAASAGPTPDPAAPDATMSGALR